MRNFYKTIPKGLNSLALASGIALGVKIFIFNQLTELFAGAYEFGVVTEGLLASILASYVFYLMVVHTKETKDKEHINPYIKRWVGLVVGDCTSQLADLSRTAKVTLELNNLDRTSMMDAMKGIRIDSNAPLFIGFSGSSYANWMQYFVFYKNSSQAIISKVLKNIQYIDSELTSILLSIDECVHFGYTKAVSQLPVGRYTIECFGEEFYKYCTLCKKLADYSESKFESIS